jgi:Fuc2NAc and GlcNAc transferase
MSVVPGGAVAVLGLLTLVTSAALTLLVRRFAFAHGILDVPNERSSHTTVTPRGGGLAIVVSATVAMTWLGLTGTMPLDLLMAMSGGVFIALIGFLDDRFGLRTGMRFAVHVAAAAWAVFWLGGMPPVSLGSHLAQLGWPGHVLGVVGLVWTLNLFNFMDGIDGIAASEAVFIACAGALLSVPGDSGSAVSVVALAFAAACCGFLLWNWPPAKIFMGDVGSGYIGFVVGVLALAATRVDAHLLWVWLILAGAFFVDATVTLIRRLLRGDRVYQAHRSHAYQWLARKWSSHLRVTVAVWVVNLLWLLPCALMAKLYPPEAPLITVGALAPLVIVAVVLGSGRPEMNISS